MSRLTDLRAAAISLIKESIADFRQVDKHVGRFTVDDLQAMLRASPSCKVGIVKAAKPERRASGETQFTVKMAAVVVTRATTVQDADDDAINRAVAVVSALAHWNPAASVQKVQPAAGFDMDAIGDEQLDRTGMVVWAITWDHVVLLGADEIAAAIGTLNVPDEVTVTIDAGAHGTETMQVPHE